MVRAAQLLLCITSIGAMGFPGRVGLAADRKVYDVTVPKGFRQVPLNAAELAIVGRIPEGISTIRYEGPRRTDGTGPRLVVTTMYVPPDPERRNDEALNRMLTDSSLADLKAKFDLDSIHHEAATIANLDGTRIRWEGSDGRLGGPVLGVIFLAVRDRVAVIMRAEDVGRQRRDGLATMEKAMLTLRMREARAEKR